MASFKTLRDAAIYAENHKRDFEEFMVTQLPDREHIYREVDYYNLDKVAKQQVDKEIQDMKELIKSQFTIYDYPQK